MDIAVCRQTKKNMPSQQKTILIWTIPILLIIISMVLWAFTKDSYLKNYNLNNISHAIANI
ncbi:MAG: hypothetical protein WCT85_05140, partial [Parachlamydiales bacterium]